MATTDDKVMKLVEDELKKNPAATVPELFEKAKKVNSAIARLSRRQFNARYPLQIKRRQQAGKPKAAKAAGKKKARRGAKKVRETATASPRAARSRGRRSAAKPNGAAVDRDAVRGAFLSFATALAAAEQRKDVVKVLAGVDRYVEQVVKALR